jgi:hypothetical protein
MSKLTNLSAMQQALPTYLRTTGVPDNVVLIVEGILHGSQYVTADYWKREWNLQDTASNRGGVVGPGFIRRLLKGAAVPAMGTAQGRTFAVPEAMPAAVTAASGQQSGVQLEYRYLPDRPNSAGLADAFKKVIDEVRAVNARHMGFFDRRSLINAADQ